MLHRSAPWSWSVLWGHLPRAEFEEYLTSRLARGSPRDLDADTSFDGGQFEHGLCARHGSRQCLVIRSDIDIDTSDGTMIRMNHTWHRLNAGLPERSGTGTPKPR